MEYDSQSLIKRYTYLQESLRVKFSRTVGIILLLSMFIGVIIIYVYKVHIFRIIDLIRYLQTKIENNKIDSIEEILSKLEDIKKLSKSFRTINNKIQSSPNLQKQY